MAARQKVRLLVGYLSDLFAVVWIDDHSVVTAAVEHFEITPILVDSFLLGSFPSLLQVFFADPMEEGHDKSLVAACGLNGPPPVTMFVHVAEPYCR